MKEVFIVAAKRSAIGGLLGSLSAYTATQLGAKVLQQTYWSLGLDPVYIDSVYFGNVLSAGLGQSPARQVGIFAGLPYGADATIINKVCASGMKAVTLGAQQIQLGHEHIIAAGGTESMSNVPHYSYMRQGVKLGNISMIDGMTKDGLWDVYNNYHMGSAAELGVKHFGFTREQLDTYTIDSYTKAQQATATGKTLQEIVPLPYQKGKEQLMLDKDEDIFKMIPEKMAQLKPVFEQDGLLTAASASNLNDGAAALILASADAVQRHGWKPLARIAGYADAAQAPEWFTTAPALAIPKAIRHAGIKPQEVDYYEINEAYASVVLSNAQLLDISLQQINVYGGAVAMGHPIGASGARILVTLMNVLQNEKGRYGVAAICNGGGAATAVVLENLMR